MTKWNLLQLWNTVNGSINFTYHIKRIKKKGDMILVVGKSFEKSTPYS